MRAHSPDARVSLLPWGSPSGNIINDNTGFGESQGKRQFQIAQDNMKLKIMTQRAHYPQFNLLDISL